MDSRGLNKTKTLTKDTDLHFWSWIFLRVSEKILKIFQYLQKNLTRSWIPHTVRTIFVLRKCLYCSFRCNVTYIDFTLRVDNVFKLANQKGNIEIKTPYWQSALLNLIWVMQIKPTPNFNNIFDYYSPQFRVKERVLGYGNCREVVE